MLVDTCRHISLVYSIVSCRPRSLLHHLPRLTRSGLFYLVSHHGCFRFLSFLIFYPLHPPSSSSSSSSCQWPHACLLMCCHDSRPRCHRQGHLHSSTEHAHQSRVRIPVLKRLRPVALEYARSPRVCVCVWKVHAVCVWIRGLGWAISVYNRKFMSN